MNGYVELGAECCWWHCSECVLTDLYGAMLLAAYLSLREGSDTRRGRRWKAVALALFSIAMFSNLALQHVLFGIESLVAYLAIVPVAAAIGALWSWLTAARLPNATTHEH